MKRILAVTMGLFVAMGAWAAGEKEEAMTITIVGYLPTATATPYDAALAKVKAAYPFVEYDLYGVDVLSGIDVTTLALVASGEAPDVYVDFVGRAGKYANPGYALELKIDETPWIQSQLDLFRVDGKLYGLPGTVPAQAMAINLDVLDKAGVVLPDTITWTIDEFLAACEAVKAAGIPDVYATGLFAVNPSGDYLWQHWFASFGMPGMFSPDYSRSFAGRPEALATWQFFDRLKRAGYVHPNAAMWTDDDYWAQMMDGNIAMFPTRPDWIANVPYRWRMMSMPSVDGAIVASIGAGAVAVGAKTKDPLRAEVIQAVIEAFSDVELQTATSRTSIPTRTDVPAPKEWVKGFDVVSECIAAEGMFDVGYSKRWYGEVRAVGPEVLNKLLKGEITPEQAHAEYYRRVRDIVE